MLQSRIFNIVNMSLNAIREYTIIAKISEFTVANENCLRRIIGNRVATIGTASANSAKFRGIHRGSTLITRVITETMLTQ